MKRAIRPDVHTRFLALVARVDAQVRSEQQDLQKRSTRMLARESRERARAAQGGGDAGVIRFEGADVSRQLSRFKRQLGVCTQEDTFDGDFTVRENLEIAASYFRPRPPAVGRRVDELLERFALATYAGDKPEALSGGFRRRLMIARALVHRPRVLFLDEPTTGLDPQARVAVWDLVNGLRADGLGIVLTTHYMDEAERLSDVLTVLAQGKVAAHGTPKSVLGDMLGEHVVVLPADGASRPAWPPGSMRTGSASR